MSEKYILNGSEGVDDLTQTRLEKLQRIKAQGLNPYPSRYRPTHTAQEALTLYEQNGTDNTVEVSVAGRITATRVMGKAAFIDIRDGSGRIQAHFRKDSLGEDKYNLLRDLDIGDFIGVEGTLFKTRTGEITVSVKDFTLLSKSLRPLPEKWHGLTDPEKRYRQRYLDLISNEEVRNIFHIRSRTVSAMRRFLEGRGFVEVETPILQPVAAGALAKPFATHHHSLDRNLYLRIATELHLKRLIIGGFDKVFEIGRVFRNEGISIKHNPEFTTMESYEAYADYNDVMEMVEQMVSFITREVLGSAKVNFGSTAIDFSPPWPRITLREAIKQETNIDYEECPDAKTLQEAMRSASGGQVWDVLREDIGDPAKLDTTSRGKLIDALLSNFVEPKLIQPTFIIDYPEELSPLAKRKPGSEHIVERFEAFAGGMEIANAFSELNDPLEQRARFEDQERMRTEFGDEEVERTDADFLTALEYGMPPTGGLGVGIDRLVMLLTGQESIREVILFPQLRAVER
ncbi:MAG: lysine--tRNA ligase [Dehalococcoidia bacterium]